MENPRKKVSNPPKDVSSSNIEIEVNQFVKAPLFNGNFDVWDKNEEFIKDSRH